jgi:hypothetical protein
MEKGHEYFISKIWKKKLWPYFRVLRTFPRVCEKNRERNEPK